MSSAAGHIPSAIGTSGFGFEFERNVQTAFVILMLAKGYSPGLRSWPIKQVFFQAKRHGANTDDIVVTARASQSGLEAKLYASIKLTASIDKGKDSAFGKTMRDAWADFTGGIFNAELDALALITGPLAHRDIVHGRELLDMARSHGSSASFFDHMKQGLGISNEKIALLEAFQFQMTHWNSSTPSEEQQWKFLQRFYLFGFDLDIRKGMMQAIMHSVLGTISKSEVDAVWRAIKEEIAFRSKHATDMTVDSLPEEIKEHFGFLSPPTAGMTTILEDELMRVAFMLGSWDEDSPGDQEVIEELSSIPFKDWKKRLRKLKRDRPEHFEQNRGLWRIVNREGLLAEMGPLFSDEDVNQLLTATLKVLSSTPPTTQAETDNG